MKYRIKDGVYHREKDGVIHIIEFENDKQYYELDAYVAQTFKLLLEKEDDLKIACIIGAECGQSVDVIFAEVKNIIAMLLTHNLIEGVL
jgi:hypothetical protein